MLFRSTSSNRELLSTINKGFYNLKASGGYDVLYNNWFGIPHKSKWEKVFFYLLLFLLIVAVIGYSFIYILRKKVKNVTKKFQIEEAKYKTIFNSTSFGLEIYDKNGYLIEVNDACAKIFRVEDPKTIINDGNRYNLFKNPILKDRINMDKYSSFSDVFEYDFKIGRAHV